MPGEHINARKTLEYTTFKGIALSLQKCSVTIFADKQEALEDYQKQIYEQLRFI